MCAHNARICSVVACFNVVADVGVLHLLFCFQLNSNPSMALPCFEIFSRVIFFSFFCKDRAIQVCKFDSCALPNVNLIIVPYTTCGRRFTLWVNLRSEVVENPRESVVDVDMKSVQYLCC